MYLRCHFDLSPSFSVENDFWPGVLYVVGNSGSIHRLWKGISTEWRQSQNITRLVQHPKDIILPNIMTERIAEALLDMLLTNRREKEREKERKRTTDSQRSGIGPQFIGFSSLFRFLLRPTLVDTTIARKLQCYCSIGNTQCSLQVWLAFSAKLIYSQRDTLSPELLITRQRLLIVCIIFPSHLKFKD